jgi:XRE family transcriptional regulator, regulator of sulfur utilization
MRQGSPAATIASSFGSRLREARMRQGLTLRDVATASDISIAYLSDLERGNLVNPTLDTLRGVTTALGVSLEQLLGVDGNGELRPAYPKALEEFRALTPFREIVASDAVQAKRDPEEVEEEWLDLLAGIRLGNRAPRNASDYLFIFEAIRRALDRR